MEILKGLCISCENCGVGSRLSNTKFELDTDLDVLLFKCFNCGKILADLDLKTYNVLKHKQLAARLDFANRDKLFSLLGAKE